MVFAAVRSAAWLVGTEISNGLIKMRKKMSLSSNFIYQALNGIGFLLVNGPLPIGFNASVVVVVSRCLNNVLGWGYVHGMGEINRVIQSGSNGCYQLSFAQP
eukprot:TRINITY_DN6090_c0_g1_i4.p1 TRINITY_DN6090_c0_g1~~TRINITY_DN6090_c0_g1_i4.p1  ORF type:complete len:102 (-),score=23.81 TRINITY_DN6090_c0_g1_i4:268-573(-)